MTTTLRKLLVIVLISAVFLVANIWCVAHWLDRRGTVTLAMNIRENYLAGTAITVIVVMLILLVRPRRSHSD